MVRGIIPRGIHSKAWCVGWACQGLCLLHPCTVCNTGPLEEHWLAGIVSVWPSLGWSPQGFKPVEVTFMLHAVELSSWADVFAVVQNPRLDCCLLTWQCCFFHNGRT